MIESTASHKHTVRLMNQVLLKHLGPQGWWPTTPEGSRRPLYRPGQEGRPLSEREMLEIIAGSILTQNTSWHNAEKAIMQLIDQDLLNLDALAHCGKELELAITPARYFNQKADRLRKIARLIKAKGGLKRLTPVPSIELRPLLLSWPGIGPETADAILCYAFNRPVFVVDTYTRRLFQHLDLPAQSYGVMQTLVHDAISPCAATYGDLHARIVRLCADKKMALIKGWRS
jgi:endonuclease-3 related protein